MSTQSPRPSAAFDGEQPLRALLEVEPADGANCALVDEVPNASTVTQTLSQRERCTVCLASAAVAEAEAAETKYLSTEITDQCVRRTIDQFECVSDLEAVEEGALVVSITVQNRTVLAAILDALEERGATVRLRRILDDDVFEAGTVELDAMAITDKQRDAAELAVDRGYYETPRRATLADLADELEISKSAVSQRLNAAERTLVRKLVGE